MMKQKLRLDLTGVSPRKKQSILELLEKENIQINRKTDFLKKNMKRIRLIENKRKCNEEEKVINAHNKSRKSSISRNILKPRLANQKKKGSGCMESLLAELFVDSDVKKQGDHDIALIPSKSKLKAPEYTRSPNSSKYSYQELIPTPLTDSSSSTVSISFTASFFSGSPSSPCARSDPAQVPLPLLFPALSLPLAPSEPLSVLGVSEGCFGRECFGRVCSSGLSRAVPASRPSGSMHSPSSPLDPSLTLEQKVKAVASHIRYLAGINTRKKNQNNSPHKRKRTAAKTPGIRGALGVRKRGSFCKETRRS